MARSVAKLGARLPTRVVPRSVNRVRVGGRNGDRGVVVHAQESTGFVSQQRHLPTFEILPTNLDNRRAGDKAISAPCSPAVGAAIQEELRLILNKVVV